MAYRKSAAVRYFIYYAGCQGGGYRPVNSYQDTGNNDGPYRRQSEVRHNQPQHSLGMRCSSISRQEHTFHLRELSEEYKEQVYRESNQEHVSHPAKGVAQGFLAGCLHGIGVHDVSLDSCSVTDCRGNGLKYIRKLVSAEDNQLHTYHRADGTGDGFYHAGLLQYVAEQNQKANQKRWYCQKVIDKKTYNRIHFFPPSKLCTYPPFCRGSKKRVPRFIRFRQILYILYSQYSTYSSISQ